MNPLIHTYHTDHRPPGKLNTEELHVLCSDWGIVDEGAGVELRNLGREGTQCRERAGLWRQLTKTHGVEHVEEHNIHMRLPANRDSVRAWGGKAINRTSNS